MENPQNNGQGTIRIKALELLKKFHYKEDRYNF